MLLSRDYACRNLPVIHIIRSGYTHFIGNEAPHVRRVAVKNSRRNIYIIADNCAFLVFIIIVYTYTRRARTSLSSLIFLRRAVRLFDGIDYTAFISRELYGLLIRLYYDFFTVFRRSFFLQPPVTGKASVLFLSRAYSSGR